jgi:hypothetical protein
MKEFLPTLILLAGFAQWSVLVASATVPIHLKWRETFAVLPKLHRQLIWAYGAYIAASIVALGLVCVTLNDELAAGGPLAMAICIYGATFWGVRLALQGVLDAKPYLTTLWLRLGYHTLTVLFVGLVAVYVAVIVCSR